jgi:hypothetical protein
MTIDHLKAGAEQTSELSCESSMCQRMGNSQHDISIMTYSDTQLVIKSFMQECKGRNLNCVVVNSCTIIVYIHD